MRITRPSPAPPLLLRLLLKGGKKSFSQLHNTVACCLASIIVGGCCELNTTAHGLIADIGTQLGIRAATASGEDVNQCVALETTRVRQRIAIEIWSNYQDYICARLKFADPTPDKQRANEDEAVTNAAEQELHAQRYAIQAYLHRTHQPLELGV